MTVIHELTASHIPLRYHEAVYPGTLKGGKIWGLFSAREVANGIRAYGRRGSRLPTFFWFGSTAGVRFGKVNMREEGRHGGAMPWGFARPAVMKVLSDLDLYYLVVLNNSNEIDIEITTPRDTCERGTWRARTGVA